MGCCESRQREFENVDSYVIQVEDSLNASRIPLSSIESEFNRYSYNNRMTNNQFQQFYNKLGIPENSNDLKIFYYFHDKVSGTTSLLKVATYFILVASGSKEEKIKQLFKLYDKDNDHNLTRLEIFSMMEIIIDISINCFINLALLLNKDSDNSMIIDYQKKLHSVNRLLIDYLVHHFCEGVTLYNFKTFRDAFDCLEMNILLIPRLLRKFALSLYQSQSSHIRRYSQNIESVEDLDKSTVKRITRKLSKINSTIY